MKRVRVLVANQARLMRELILSTIADQTDIEVIGEVCDPIALAQIIEEKKPDVLIVDMDRFDESRVQCQVLLAKYPEMKILTLDPQQNRALCYWAKLDIKSKPLESSEAGILDAMREPGLAGGLSSA